MAEPDPFYDDRFDITAKIPREDYPQRKQVDLPVLRVAAGPDLTSFAQLHQGQPVIVGRDETAGLQLNDASVSRHHLRVVWEEGDEFVVTDLQSTNGTRLNGQAITRAAMLPNAHLEVGTVSLRLDMMNDDELSHLRKVRARLLMAENRDPLTGLLTRAFLEDDLPRLAATCARAGLPICCLFFDLDHFKSVNDRFSHATGDEVLKVVARLAMLDCRDSDYCVRYGGEEYVIILQDSSIEGAIEAANRLRRTVKGHDWSRTAAGLSVSISCGAALRRVNEDIGAWIGRADRAMYVAKRQGRNRVCRAIGD